MTSYKKYSLGDKLKLVKDTFGCGELENWPFDRDQIFVIKEVFKNSTFKGTAEWLKYKYRISPFSEEEDQKYIEVLLKLDGAKYYNGSFTQNWFERIEEKE